MWTNRSISVRNKKIEFVFLLLARHKEMLQQASNTTTSSSKNKIKFGTVSVRQSAWRVHARSPFRPAHKVTGFCVDDVLME